MKYVVAALPNDAELASWIGKKGTSNGLIFYNRRIADTHLVLLTPADLTNKFYALGESFTLADHLIASTKSLDAVLGEAIIAASLLGKELWLTDDSDVRQLLKGFEGSSIEQMPRNVLIERLGASLMPEEKGDVRIDIDKSFPVKGVGTVLLGIVRRGRVRVHDTLYLSTGREIPIRSIQVHDEDVPEAGRGARVGLAVKGIDDKEIRKGDVLSLRQVPYTNSITAALRLSPFVEGADIEGMTCTLASSFSVSSCRLSRSESGQEYALRLERPLPLESGDSFLLMREAQPRVFGAGRITGTGADT